MRGEKKHQRGPGVSRRERESECASLGRVGVERDSERKEKRKRTAVGGYYLDNTDGFPSPCSPSKLREWMQKRQRRDKPLGATNKCRRRVRERERERERESEGKTVATARDAKQHHHVLAIVFGTKQCY
jgi:hypothetical protein